MTALYVLLALAGLLVLALSVPVVLRAEYYDSFALQLRWLFLRVRLAPARPKKPKKKKKKPKKEKQKEDKPKKEKTQPNVFARFYQYQGVPGFIELLRRTVAALKKFGHGLWRCFLIRELNFAMRITGDDPEALAVQYGKLGAAIFPPLGWLCSKLRTRKGKIHANIYPDFTGLAPKRMECTAEVSVIPLVLLGALAVLLARLGTQVALKFLKGAKPPKKKIESLKN